MVRSLPSASTGRQTGCGRCAAASSRPRASRSQALFTSRSVSSVAGVAEMPSHAECRPAGASSTAGTGGGVGAAAGAGWTIGGGFAGGALAGAARPCSQCACASLARVPVPPGACAAQPSRSRSDLHRGELPLKAGTQQPSRALPARNSASQPNDSSSPQRRPAGGASASLHARERARDHRREAGHPISVGTPPAAAIRARRPAGRRCRCARGLPCASGRPQPWPTAPPTAHR